MQVKVAQQRPGKAEKALGGLGKMGWLGPWHCLSGIVARSMSVGCWCLQYVSLGISKIFNLYFNTN